MTLQLFSDTQTADERIEPLSPGAAVLRAFARSSAAGLVEALEEVIKPSPFRRMTTPGGYRMSVAMTNCGDAGWVTDGSGYRYDAFDPTTGERWPAMPGIFRELAARGAAEAGFAGFVPDACLMSRYEPGARLSLHQDKDERDLESPIVSVSLGLPATFLFGGHRRGDRPRRVPLVHGDVVVWGGPARLRFHGVLPLEPGRHPMLGAGRINLSFRRIR
ncbi:MAG TPA: DNA oxidative demethylase AlkB [Steroidobacteraceae bacterium]|nr:DNA oxidative demethylase AlkB [Steroidobacteraceae bacterium]